MQMLASTVLSVNEEISTYRSQVHSIDFFRATMNGPRHYSIIEDIKYEETFSFMFSEQVDDLLKRVEYVENDWNVLVGAPRRSFQSSCIFLNDFPGQGLKGASQRFLESLRGVIFSSPSKTTQRFERKIIVTDLV